MQVVVKEIVYVDRPYEVEKIIEVPPCCWATLSSAGVGHIVGPWA